jgi:CarboxypepD_reg-like domain
MRYLAFLLFFFLGETFAQQNISFSGTVQDAVSKTAVVNASIINKSKGLVAVSDSQGKFFIEVSVKDTLTISHIAFEVNQTVIKENSNNLIINLVEKTNQIEEIVVSSLKLTGYLEIDTKRIKVNENYRYTIAGLNLGYEPGRKSKNAFDNFVDALSNPVDLVYSLFNKKDKELVKLLAMKKDENFKKLLATQTNRQSLILMLQLQKAEINTILEKCNYSKVFIDTASDLQVLDAIASSYEDYKMFKK